MLQVALQRPGVREAMAIHDHWQEAERGLSSYRTIGKRPHSITSTDHANAG